MPFNVGMWLRPTPNGQRLYVDAETYSSRAAQMLETALNTGVLVLPGMRPHLSVHTG
jgi:hypothetical protein